VHGHDEKLRLEVENFLLRLGLEPVVLFKEPSEGKTIIEKIEKESDDICFAIVIYSACDLGIDRQLVKTTADLHKRARQNVVFEHGYLLCKLGRNRVCALVEKDVETPGDMDGVVYIPTSNNWRSEVWAQPTNPVECVQSLTQKHVAKRYMIGEKFLPLRHES
jgi:predicted nucleotide-binding protein